MGGSKSAHVLRFAVVNGTGRSSASWKLWTGNGRKMDETYLAPRAIGGDLKLSLHADGYCQLGPDRGVRNRSAPGDREALNRWRVDPNVMPRVIALVEFHRAQLREGVPDIGVTHVGIEPGEQGLLLAVMVVEDDSSVQGMVEDGLRFLGSLERSTRGIVALMGAPLEVVGDVSNQVMAFTQEATSGWTMPTDPWSIPFGWVVRPHDDDKPPVIVEFAAEDGELETRSQPLRDFAGDIGDWDDLPISAHEESCAAIAVHSDRSEVLYQNHHSRCQHDHLMAEVESVLDGFRRRGPDAGWDLIGPDSEPDSQIWVTQIVTDAARKRMLDASRPSLGAD